MFHHPAPSSQTPGYRSALHGWLTVRLSRDEPGFAYTVTGDAAADWEQVGYAVEQLLAGTCSSTPEIRQTTAHLALLQVKQTPNKKCWCNQGSPAIGPGSFIS